MNITRYLILLLLLFCTSTSIAKTVLIPTSSNHKIVLNQIGYLPHIKKEALLLSEHDSPKGQWQVLDADTDAKVASGQLPEAKQDQHTHYKVQSIDFSFLNKAGRYIVQVGDLRSVPFEIGEEVYQPLIHGLLRSYYLQRCGERIADQITGMQRPACHLHDGIMAHSDAFNAQGNKLMSVGSWHDAGDYGKYVGPASIVLLELLSRYERYQEPLSMLDLNIPESGNGTPDFLDEMQIALDWMLTMQREDGAVYRKLSGKQWPHQVAPHDDKQARFIYGISSQETGKAIASWALAARIYKAHNAKLANRYQQAALLSWQWLQTQNAMVLDEHKDDNSGSGPYTYNEIDQNESLTHHDDDQFAAAMELHLSETGQGVNQFLEAAETNLALAIMEWKNPSAQAMLSALWHPVAQVSLYKTRESIRMKLRDRAADAYQRTQNSEFGLANHQFVWGSNKMAAQEGMFLKQAAYYFQNADYEEAAWNQLHYLLGRNAHNQTFVSGFGTHPVKNVNHIYARTTGIHIPGLFVGGPNSSAQAGKAPKDKGPLSYVDDDHSYATNEYAIDYNSGLLALLFDLLYLGRL